MSIGSYKSREIVIAGTGIAAAATALRLISLGFVPRLFSLGRAILPGVEAIPEAAFSLITDLGLDGAVARAGGKIVEGFENAWVPSAPALLQGKWLHVERSAFASAAIDEAVSRGAARSIVETLPSVPSRCLAAIDATGRSAAWSRPIRRRGNQVADLFEISSPLERGRIERSPDGWMYRIGSTLGVVSTCGRANTPKGARYLGRRPAFPQWCENPIQGRRIAVGDAAFSCDPLAGQGIRFALASAFAAASVIQYWKENSNRGAANRFYRDFVGQARVRHLEFLAKLELDLPADVLEPLPKRLSFSGRIGSAELSVNSRIVTDRVIILTDKSAVRWVGGVDLLEFAEVAGKSASSVALITYLASTGVDNAQARAVLSWCIRKGVLKAIT